MIGPLNIGATTARSVVGISASAPSHANGHDLKAGEKDERSERVKASGRRHPLAGIVVKARNREAAVGCDRLAGYIARVIGTQKSD